LIDWLKEHTTKRVNKDEEFVPMRRSRIEIRSFKKNKAVIVLGTEWVIEVPGCVLRPYF